MRRPNASSKKPRAVREETLAKEITRDVEGAQKRRSCSGVKGSTLEAGSRRGTEAHSCRTLGGCEEGRPQPRTAEVAESRVFSRVHDCPVRALKCSTNHPLASLATRSRVRAPRRATPSRRPRGQNSAVAVGWMKRLMRLVASNISDAAQRNAIDARRCAAAGMEIPIPVASATYAATHQGTWEAEPARWSGRSSRGFRRHAAIGADHRAVSRAVVAAWQRQ